MKNKSQMKVAKITILLQLVFALSSIQSVQAQPLATPKLQAAANMDATAQSYQQKCAAANGYFQYGTVNAPPNSDYPQVTNYRSGKKRQGIPLSHTHIEITSAIDGKVYDVAIDNVFANDYSPKKFVVPPSYVKGITANSTLYLCSGNPSKVPYSENEGIASLGFDWVHTNCAASGYKTSFDNGFIYTDKAVNLTNSQTYCYLWPSN